MTHSALIIDDEADIRELIALSLERIGLDTHTAANLDEARNLLDTYQFDVCLSDMKLPDGNGSEFVKYVHSIQPSLPVAVITAHGNMQAAVDAMKNGAFDFVSKPVDLKLLRQLVVQAIDSNKNAANDAQTAHRNNQLAEPRQKQQTNSQPASACRTSDEAQLVSGEKLIGHSKPIQELRQMIRKVARTNAPVWITGESGTGKELIARLVHDNSPRADAPFVAINCGAIPADLMESEMFGHMKGSFTGAHADSEGLFQRAQGGTLFLDEVAELPLHMQVKLLRAIQERSVKPVGSSTEIAIDARILSASHANLSAAVEAGTFRNDLYYRLNVICIESPPLRTRLDDIPLLAQFIMNRPDHIYESTGAISLSSEALDALERYDFPGNIRELENLLERACALCEGNVITANDLLLHGHTGKPSQPKSVVSEQVDTEEIQQIIEALNQTRWNRKAAARLLGVSYRQLRYRIKKLGLENNSAS